VIKDAKNLSCIYSSTRKQLFAIWHMFGHSGFSRRCILVAAFLGLAFSSTDSNVVTMTQGRGGQQEKTRTADNDTRCHKRDVVSVCVVCQPTYSQQIPHKTKSFLCYVNNYQQCFAYTICDKRSNQLNAGPNLQNIVRQIYDNATT